MSDTQVTTQTPTENPAQARRVEYLRPQYSIEQAKDAYQVHVTLPGVPRDSVSITVEKDTLTVEGSRTKVGQDNWQARYREIPQADYRLRLDLNVPVDADKIRAAQANGVLTITLPVAEAAKPRQISVN